MDWEEHEKDELLVRYLDHELTSNEIDRFEQLLITDPNLRQKLSDWQALGEKLNDLKAQNPTGRRLDASFADRVIRGAKTYVSEQDDPNLAPWIPRESLPTIVEPASRLQARDRESNSISGRQDRRRDTRRWIVRGSLIAVAASLLVIFALNLPRPQPNTLVSPGENLAEQGPRSEGKSTNQIVIHGGNETTSSATDSVAPPSNLESTALLAPDKAVQNSTTTMQSSNALADAAPSPTGSKEGTSFSVGPDLKPNAEQIKMLEDMMKNPSGLFLMVIDVRLPEGIADLDALRGTLDRHDIAWASELDIDESIQSNLEKSRMIAEAGKRGLIPDFVDPTLDRSASKNSSDKKEVVSLVFVKARGSRLDAAIVEVMRQTEEFPDFSFDLAFDPPTHALMNELRFIQEASLAEANRPTHENVSNVVQRSRGSHFLAGPRRSKSMEIETRRQGRLPLEAESINPISYALFIVRHAEPNSTR
jgi:hypothetical protein